MGDEARVRKAQARAGTHGPAHACANCGTPLESAPAPPRFCPQCGQETALHPPSVTEFAHEFVGHYIALEGPLWKTLGLLLLRPGRLTSEYLRGRRRRYVLPLRLYLSASFLFFLAFKLYVPTAPEEEAASAQAPSSAASAAASSASSPGPARQGGNFVIVSPAGVRVASAAEAAVIVRESLKADCAAELGRPCNWFEHKAHAASRRWVADPQAAQASLATHWTGVAPYAAFLMQPVFAALVALAYRRRRMVFGEHLVFSMHVHAFWFLAALLALFVPDAAKAAILLVAPGYLALALREVYAGGWGGTLLRGASIVVVYGVLLAAVSLAIAAALFLR